MHLVNAIASANNKLITEVHLNRDVCLRKIADIPINESRLSHDHVRFVGDVQEIRVGDVFHRQVHLIQSHAALGETKNCLTDSVHFMYVQIYLAFRHISEILRFPL